MTGNQIRTGMALDLEGKIFRVTKTQHVKPGKGGAYVQVFYFLGVIATCSNYN